MSGNPFLETLQNHSDQKLKEMVGTKRGDYQKEAVAAAAQILRARNVKFDEAEPDEEIEMTYEEIREDIRARRAKGQSMSGIREYYKSCGVDIDSSEIRRGEENPGSRPWSFREIRFVFFIAGGLGAAFLAINEHGMNGGAVIVILVLGAFLGIWVLLRYMR